MIICKNVQNTELYKEDRKNRLQLTTQRPQQLIIRYISFQSFFFPLWVDLFSFSKYIYLCAELELYYLLG